MKEEPYLMLHLLLEHLNKYRLTKFCKNHFVYNSCYWTTFSSSFYRVRIIPYNGQYDKEATVRLADIIDLGDTSNSGESLPEYVHIVDGPFSDASKDPGVRFVRPSNYQKNGLLAGNERRTLPDASLAVGTSA